ncbi:glycerate kinase [Persicobacter psychrovividus]|uniref:Glycerate kinase n=1 Tax=Persicobacter psychrovividus TaxID=387638 RepID=A0ABN6L7C9_9BACT|nr:glycerate kinase [Persicobacter psychrovividus]
MKIILATDSFKGSLTAQQVRSAMKKGIYPVYPNAEIIEIPMADGGEGTIEALVEEQKNWVTVKVHDPLFRLVDAKYGLTDHGKTAVIEMAQASGLPLLKMEEQNPWVTTTFGTGELILDALNKGVRNFIIGIGGSATNDGGKGMLEALGFEFLDRNKNPVPHGAQGLAKVEHLQNANAHPGLKNASFKIACDVDNPFYGPRGATYIYGAQKGANAEMLDRMEKAMIHFAEKIHHFTGIDLRHVKGSGAGGGISGAFFAMLNGALKSGVDIILDHQQFDHHLEGADIVLSGEGKIDHQSVSGKVIDGIAKRCTAKNVPLIVLGGGVMPETQPFDAAGITAVFSIINEPVSLEKAMNPATAAGMITFKTTQVFRLIQQFN